jgi:glycosyltransferase involved in cell wall biosynthesis
MKVLFVTNFISHYRAPFFELLQKRVSVEYLLFTAGDEPYWQGHLGVTSAEVNATVVPGFEVLPRIRVNPRLLWELATRRYDVMVKCINGRTELAVAFLVAKARGKPFVLWTSIWEHPYTPFHRFSGPVSDYIYRHSDAIVTDGEHVKAYLVSRGIDARKVFAAELAVDNDFFAAPIDPRRLAHIRQRLHADGDPVILAVARLVAYKGLDVLIEAAAQLDDLKPVVAIIGTGPNEEALRSQALARGVRLELLGGWRPGDMPLAYAAADLVVLPSVRTSIGPEVWGLALNEAMCRGVPVVTTDAVGAAVGGLVVDGVTGVVVSEKDPVALGAALRRLLESPEVARKIGAAGRDRVMRTTFATMADGYVAAIDYAVDAGRRRG